MPSFLVISCSANVLAPRHLGFLANELNGANEGTLTVIFLLADKAGQFTNSSEPNVSDSMYFFIL